MENTLGVAGLVYLPYLTSILEQIVQLIILYNFWEIEISVEVVLHLLIVMEIFFEGCGLK